MDIAALSMNMSAASFINELGTAVLDKSLEQSEDMSQSMIKMMEASVTPHLGQNLDIMA